MVKNHSRVQSTKTLAVTVKFKLNPYLMVTRVMVSAFYIFFKVLSVNKGNKAIRNSKQLYNVRDNATKNYWLGIELNLP